MSELRLRIAELQDVPVLSELMPQSVLGLSDGYYTEQQAASAAKYITVPDREIIADRTYYVVEWDDKLVGCGGWSRRQKLFTGTAEQEEGASVLLDPEHEPARIRAMFVDASVARRGVGRMILEACEAAAREEGFRELELMGTLPGAPFYERMGFRAVEAVDVPLPDGVQLPCIRMVKRL